MYKIVFNAAEIRPSAPKECWLKASHDQRALENFVQRWQGKEIQGSVIHCEKEEDELELCNFDRLGKCRNSAEDCLWEHVECTARGSCASTCRYGHQRGVKYEKDYAPSK